VVRRLIHKLSRLAVLPALLAGAACDAPVPSGPAVTFDPCRPLALTPDADASAPQRAGVAAGMALWTAVLPVKLSLKEASTDTSPDASPAASPAETVPVHFQSAAANFHGLYDAAAAQIFINNDLADAPLAIAVAHEVGHAFGLAHVSASERPSVMNPGNLTVEPNAADAASLMSAWGTCESPVSASASPSP
jgi:hypothetical protein